MKGYGIALLLVLNAFLFEANSQEAVYFFSADSMHVRADLYRKDNANPYIILCATVGSDRREYQDIAPRLLNLNYNCLAINLRKGNKYPDALKDIQAAIRFLKPLSNQPVILWGSSASASLCMMAAVKNPRVKAVIALNPGEYLLPWKSVRNEASHIQTPLLVFAVPSEFPYIQEMLSGMPPSIVTLFKPEKGTPVRGNEAFTARNPENAEYWFALTLFFKKMNQ
jgi:pimeloyl-ACP methyl ester carboxylesterase